jgi:hypothetical protein
MPERDAGAAESSVPGINNYERVAAGVVPITIWVRRTSELTGKSPISRQFGHHHQFP